MFCLPQIVISLNTQPNASLTNARTLQAYSQIRADRRMTVQYTGKMWARKNQMPCQFGNTDAQLGQNIHQQCFTGVWRVVYGHEPACYLC